jgi:hypothetical protein
MEYESVTQKVLISLESILKNAKTSTYAPFMARKMSKRYSISLQVFSSICGVTVSIAAPFRAEHYHSLEIALTNVG